MTDWTGRFVWYELMTTDIAGARDFYTKVVGWEAKDSHMSGMEYWMFHAGSEGIGGMMTLPEEAKAMGAPPHWLGYVAVKDVDASAAQVTAASGRIYVPPTDIPNVGRFAVVADPQGAVIALFKGSMEAPPETSNPMETAGHVGWHELYAAEWSSAFDFYAKLFGWVKKDAMDMGPAGTYQIYGTPDVTLGGMMNKIPEMPVPNWSYYFNVGNIDEAVDRVKAGGGQVIMGPMEVPGGGFVIKGIDPQGAHFSLFGSR